MYCSFEARKVIDCIEDYGITVSIEDYIKIESWVGRFWNTHIQKVIKDIMARGVAIDNVENTGVATYFEKPILSILTPRGGAHRSIPVDFTITDHVTRVYDIVCTSLCLTDFNMDELRLLVCDVAPMIAETIQLSNAIEACKRTQARSVFYLHGVVRREYQTAQGRIREIQAQAAVHETQGWTVPEDFDKMDVIERKELDIDWRDKLNSITITRALNEEN
jgi:hypothetical protein